MKSKFATVWRPVLIGFAVLALLVGSYSLPTTRALARQMLSVFRVRKFAVIQIQPDEAQLEQVVNKLGDAFFTREPEVIVDEAPVEVGTIEEAEQIAGFPVRVPSYWPQGEMKSIEVKGRSEFVVPFKREGLRLLFELAEMDPALIPGDWEEASASILVPAGVYMADERAAVIQVLSPEVEYPAGIDPQLVGQAVMRVLGVSPDDAERLARTIDWTSTLVLPLPKDMADITEITIAGEPAVLITPRERDMDNVAALVFEKDGIVYVVRGNYANETMVQMAESLFW